MELELFAKLADDKNKVEKLIIFISLLIIEAIFSFWIASLFGYNYNGSELNFKNIVMFFSSYQILIPLFSFLISYLVFHGVMSIGLMMYFTKKFKKQLYEDEPFKELLKELGIIGGEIEDYEFLKEHYGGLITKEGQDKLYSIFVLFFSLSVILFGLIFCLSFWFIIPFLIVAVFTFFNMYGFFAIKVIYLRKKDLQKIIENEHNRNIGEVSE